MEINNKIKIIMILFLFGISVSALVPIDRIKESDINTNYSEADTNLTIEKWIYDLYNESNTNLTIEKWIYDLYNESNTNLTIEKWIYDLYNESNTNLTIEKWIYDLYNESNTNLTIEKWIYDLYNESAVNLSISRWPYNESAVNITIDSRWSFSDIAWIDEQNSIYSNKSINNGDVNISGNLSVSQIFSNNFYISTDRSSSLAGRSFGIITGDNHSTFIYYPIAYNTSRFAYIDFGINRNSFTDGITVNCIGCTTPSFLPYTTKAMNLGLPAQSWDNCYCDDYTTTSRGWMPNKDISALDALKTLDTMENGEINHFLQDSSFRNNDNENTTSLNAVLFASVDAIRKLDEKISVLEKEVDALKNEK